MLYVQKLENSHMKLVLYKLDQLVYYILEINIIYMIKEIIMIVILIMKE